MNTAVQNTQQQIGAPFAPDMSDRHYIEQAKFELSMAGQDEHRLAAWASRYAEATIEALDDAERRRWQRGS